MIHARKDYNRIQDPENIIPEDEPVFLIRAQDINGAEVVRYWAELAKNSGASDDIINKALNHVKLMENWKIHKVPDLSISDDENQSKVSFT